jgi:hypothetical protein
MHKALGSTPNTTHTQKKNLKKQTHKPHHVTPLLKSFQYPIKKKVSKNFPLLLRSKILIQGLPNKCEAISSNPSTTGKKTKKTEILIQSCKALWPGFCSLS